VCPGEGFFPHKTSCKKYFWCLEAAGLGMVAHTFTCPTGLYFSTLTDGCDFRRNVDCGDKTDSDESSSGSSESTTASSTTAVTQASEESPRSLKDILSEIKDAGDVGKIN
jgi:chitinase